MAYSRKYTDRGTMLDFDWGDDYSEVWAPEEPQTEEDSYAFLEENDPDEIDIQISMADALFTRICEGMQMCEGPDRLRSAIVIVENIEDPRESIVLQPEEAEGLIDIMRHEDRNIEFEMQAFI
jgi:hypothetical protein